MNNACLVCGSESGDNGCNLCSKYICSNECFEKHVGCHAGAQKEGGNIIVRGSGMREARPDRAMIRMHAEGTGRTPAESMRASEGPTKRMEKVLRTFGNSVKGEKTFVTTDVIRDKDTDRIIEYRTSSHYVVSMSILSDVPVFVHALTNAGAVVDSTRYYLEDEKATQMQALADATRDARDRARVIAESLGNRLGSLVHISDETYHRRPAMAMMRNESVIDPGVIKIVANVMAKFSFL